MGGHLWLIGMMGSGKSATGRALAERRAVPFADTDDLVAARTGSSVASLWGSLGEQAFRDMEADAIGRIAAASEPTVVATGGGAVLRPESAELIRATGVVVWLTAAPAVLAGRLGAGPGRPLLAEAPVGDRLDELLEERRPIYAAAAHFEVATDGKDPAEVADELESLWPTT